jgi:hypothetical protein
MNLPKRSIRQAITDEVGAEDIAKADSPSTKMALALAATGRKVYEGTVPARVVAKRRAKSKAARKARRAAR